MDSSGWLAAGPRGSGSEPDWAELCWSDSSPTSFGLPRCSPLPFSGRVEVACPGWVPSVLSRSLSRRFGLGTLLACSP